MKSPMATTSQFESNGSARDELDHTQSAFREVDADLNEEETMNRATMTREHPVLVFMAVGVALVIVAVWISARLSSDRSQLAVA